MKSRARRSDIGNNKTKGIGILSPVMPSLQ